MSEVLQTDQHSGKTRSLWRLPAVKAVTGLGRSSIYQLISVGKFPRQIAYHGRVGWVSTEVEAWVELQIAEGRRVSNASVPVAEHNAE